MARRIRPLCAVLFGEEAVAQNMQFFNKPPRMHYVAGDSSKPTPPHQDGYYFMLDTRDEHLACTMWLALDDATRENGCLRYTLGSARRGMRSHEYSGIMGFSQHIVDYDLWDRSHEVAIEAAPGDLIIHSALMIHRAEGNETAELTRRAVGAICYGISARRDEAAYAAKARAIRERAAHIAGQTAASVGLSARIR
jgi:phytanoyl-CoA hydroxylase